MCTIFVWVKNISESIAVLCSNPNEKIEQTKMMWRVMKGLDTALSAIMIAAIIVISLNLVLKARKYYHYAY